jgi:hypothetical protein
MLALILVVILVLLAGAIHETGHFVVALAYGEKLSFRREGFRGIWNMPETFTPEQKKQVAIAGFGLELIAAIPMLIISPFWGLIYQVIADFHFIAYTFYAGEKSDFKHLI